jgi:hypothetical protein
MIPCYHFFMNMDKMLLYKKTNCTLSDNNRYSTKLPIPLKNSEWRRNPI